MESAHGGGAGDLELATSAHQAELSESGRLRPASNDTGAAASPSLPSAQPEPGAATGRGASDDSIPAPGLGPSSSDTVPDPATSRPALREEASVIAEELRKKLEQIVERGNHEADDENDTWVRDLHDTQRRLRALFQRWDWDMQLARDDEVRALLRLCVFPEPEFMWTEDLGDFQRQFLVPKDVPAARLKSLASLSRELADGGELRSPLFASVLARQIDEMFGLDRFLPRLQTTIKMNRRLVGLVPVLMSLAALRTASEPSSPSHTKDLALLALGQMHAMAKVVVELRSQLQTRTGGLESERESKSEISEALVYSKVEASSSSGHAAQLIRKVNDLETELNQVSGRAKELEEKLAKAQARMRTLYAANVVFQNKADSEKDLPPRFDDELLDRIYQFTWKHARVSGNENHWYWLLRAAAINSPAEAPLGLSVALMQNDQDNRVWASPTPSKQLQTFRKLARAGSEESREGRRDSDGIPELGESPSDLDDEVPELEIEDPEPERPSSAGSHKRQALELVSSPEGSAPQSKRPRTGPSPPLPTDPASQALGSTPPRQAKKHSQALNRAQLVQLDASDSDPETKATNQVPLPSSQVGAGNDGLGSSSQAGAGNGGLGPSSQAGAEDGRSGDVAERAPRTDSDFIFAQPQPPGADDGYIKLPRMREGVYEDWTSLPTRPGSEPATLVAFQEIRHPQKVGSVSGRSSTVRYFTMTESQFSRIYGLPIQMMNQVVTAFYPNYALSKNAMVSVMQRQIQNGADAYAGVMALKPWNKMWRDRVVEFYLFDPRELSENQVRWLTEYLVFQFQYREAFWLLGHWLALSKEPGRASPELRPWYEIHRRRTQYISRFRAAWKALEDRCPLGLSQLVYSEPAVWYASSTCCWIPWELSVEQNQNLSTSGRADEMFEQLGGLDELEPVRARWSTAPSRFVEALFPEQIDLLENNVDREGHPICWRLPDNLAERDLVRFSQIHGVSTIGLASNAPEVASQRSKLMKPARS